MSDLPVFYWRPGCGFCAALRWQLQGLGIPLQEINIWRDPGAAARVRSVAGGNETVPTLVVGERSLVNPTVDEVATAVRAWRPELIGSVPVTQDRSVPLLIPALSIPALAAIAAAGLWTFLAIGNPAVTYHLAPAVVVAAGPLLGRFRGGPLGRTAALAATAIGVVVAVVTTVLLASSGALAGPTVTGGGNASAECFIVIAAAALVTPWAVWRRK